MGISQHYFKLSTLWMCVCVLIIGVYIWDTLTIRKKISKNVYLASGCFCCAFFSITCFKLGNVINFEYAAYIVVLILLYVLMLILINRTNKCNLLVMILFLGEIMYSATLNSEQASSNAKYLEATKNGNYSTNNFVEISNDEEFYRVGKKEENYGSKVMLYDYNGTGYCDDISKSYVDFVENIIEQRTLLEHMYGGYENEYWLLDFLLCVKYRIIDEEDFYLPKYYQVVKKENGISYIKNNNKISLGYMYDNYITNEQINTLDYKTRQYNLLNALVLEDTKGKTLANIINYPSYAMQDLVLVYDNGDIVEYDKDNDLYEISIDSEITNIFIPIWYRHRKNVIISMVCAIFLTQNPKNFFSKRG